MTVVSSKEFSTNQKKYFDLAIDEDVVIKRGSNMFRLMYKPVETQYPEQVILEPDDNLRRAITAEELLERIHEDIRNKFAMRCK
jgi:hypothetical protein